MSILDSIGNTPLVEIKNIWKSDKVRIFAKLEGMNPSGSVKDRIALYMIQKAIEKKELKPGMRVIEATSGNTGISLAMVSAALKYKCILVMPKAVSKERRQIIKAYGASIILAEGGTDGAIETLDAILAQSIVDEARNEFYNPDQFSNDNNWKAHYHYTAPEITQQLAKLLYWSHWDERCNPTHFISAYGTTGTIRGCSLWFKHVYSAYKLYKTKIIAVSPKKDSRIQGLKNLQYQIVPKIHRPQYIDETMYADDAKSFDMTRRLAREEGIFCGMSSGAAMYAAIRVAEEQKDFSTIVVILPDSGNRYLSEGIF